MKSCEAYGMSAIVSQFFSIEFEYYQSKNVIRRYNAESDNQQLQQLVMLHF